MIPAAHIAVLDVGKTHVRVCLVSAQGEITTQRERETNFLPGPPYPHADVGGLFNWICNALGELGAEHPIEAIVPVAHGATAALLGRDGLALPVLDYEFDGLAPLARPAQDLAETGSPDLPAGLNLARQIAWQERTFPAEFARVESILPWPQYWAWRFGGRRACEVTSLGCHTHLWSLHARDFSRLVTERGWRRLFPPRVQAWECLGTLAPEIAARTRLDPACRIQAGIHDSNASYLVHRVARGVEPFAVVSSGTWVVCLAHGAPLERLRAELDMLANVDVFGDPVACMRFQGGREYAALCGEEGLAESPDFEDVLRVIEAGMLALPGFSDQGGPFARRRGEIKPVLPRQPRERAALASLYCALMIDLCLDQLGVRGDVVLEGRMAHNTALTGTLAALRAPAPCLVSDDPTGTVRGAAMLARWGSSRAAPRVHAVESQRPAAVKLHRQRWRAHLQ